jgi:hypothetical protein
MLGPYRDPVLQEAEPLPNACVPKGERQERCPWDRRRIVASLAARPFVRVLSVSATLLLLVASASLSAITWTVTGNLLAARGRVEAAKRVRQATRNGQALVARASDETHDVDALWARAERSFHGNGTPTLARASLSPAAFATVTAPVHVAFESGSPGHGALRVLDAAEGSHAALLGLKRGDRILSVDGYGLSKPEDALTAYAHLAWGKSALLELEREGRAVALRLDPLGDGS